MAKGNLTGGTRIKTHKRKRKGVHSKKNSSNFKRSKNYKKKYVGQG